MPGKILAAVYEALNVTPILTAKQIAERYGYSPKAVVAAIRTVSPRMPTIYSRPSADAGGYQNSVKEYSLAPFPASRRAKSVIAPRYVPPFEEMTRENYDLWQARNLAMLVR